MKIAIFCPVHRRPDLVLEQIKNYEIFHGQLGAHVLHPSLEGSNEFLADQSLVSKENVLMNTNSYLTSWKCVFGAYLSNSRFLENVSPDEFTHVYLHTDGDLLLAGNLAKHIKKYEVGFSGAFPKKEWNWPHYKKMVEDDAFRNLRSHLGLTFEDIKIGRQEGAFFPVKLWFEAISIIERFYSKSFFDDPNAHWPVEEAVLPTVMSFLTSGFSVSKNIVRTKELKYSSATGNGRDLSENCVSPEDIKHAINTREGDDCVGLKWFSTDLNNESRVFLKELLFGSVGQS